MTVPLVWWRKIYGASRNIRPKSIEVGAVAALVLLIQVVMFSGYYRGTTSPSGDFLASYNSEAFSWWRDGGVLHPPAWMPYSWGGFPAAAQVQNSAWYLPTGAFVLLGQSGITGAAIEQALHVAFAGIGVYVLGRRGGFGPLAAAFGLVAYSFTTGFFTEAPYIDIVRGFAFAPWILLCLSPLWPWRKGWAVPLAALLLWQAACGIYPGILVAVAYSSIAWILVWQIVVRPRFRSYFGNMLFAGLIAIALSAPKFLPQLGLGTIGRGAVQDLTVFSPSTMATLFLPPFPGMPGVYSLNLYFVPAAMVLLVVVASLRRPVVRGALAMLAVAAALGIPQSPFREILGFLPGLSSSRFRLNDYLPIAFTSVVLLSMAGLERIQHPMLATKRRRGDVLRTVAILAPMLLVFVMLLRGPFRGGDWVPTVAILVVTALVLIVCLLASRRAYRSKGWALFSTGVCVVLAAASGIAHSRTVVTLWAADTQAEQRSLWGVTAEQLIAHRVDFSGVERPARTPVGSNSQEFGWTGYNSSFYTGVPAVGGYFSVHQSAAYVEAGRVMSDPTMGPDARAFWAAPGILEGSAPGRPAIPTASALASCVASGECGPITSRPIEYRAGALTYSVTASTATTVVANEAFYPGWSVLLSDATGANLEVPPTLGPAGSVAFDIPAGQWRLSLKYLTPYEEPAMLGFFGGVLALVASLSVGLRSRRGRSMASER